MHGQTFKKSGSFNPETNALFYAMPIEFATSSHRPPLMTQPRYAQVALLEALSELSGVPRVRIEVDGQDVWALASVTHNASQHVTIVSPQ